MIICVTERMMAAGAWKLAQLTDGGLTPEFVVFEVFSAMLSAHTGVSAQVFPLRAVRDM